MASRYVAQARLIEVYRQAAYYLLEGGSPAYSLNIEPVQRLPERQATTGVDLCFWGMGNKNAPMWVL